MKKCLPILKISTILLVFVLTAFAANAQKTAIAGGSWSTPTTWSPVGMPGAGDAVIINSGITVTMDALNGACASLTINVNAGATANGLAISGSNTLTVGGNVTLNQPTALTSTLAIGAGTLTVNGTISIPGSATAGRFATASVSTGTINCDAVTFSGTAAQARLTFTGAGTLKVGNGTTGTLGTGGTLTMFAGNTINYDGSAQTVRPSVIYNNLKLSGSGVKTLTTVTTVNTDMTLSGTATATTAANFTVGGNLSIGNGTSLMVPAFSIDVTGITTIDGSFISSSTTGSKTFNDLVINNGGLFSSTANGNYGISGNLQVNGTGSITSGTGTWTFSGAGTPALSGTGSATITNAAFTKSYTNNGTFSFTNLDVQGPATVNLTNNGIISVSATLTGTDNFIQGTTGILNFGGTTLGNSGFAASAAGNIVNYTASAIQTINGVPYSNLTLSGTSTKTLGAAISVSGTLSMQGTASLALGGNTLTYGASSALEYAGSTAQTTTSIEFKTPGGPFNLKINNSNGVTLHAARTINGDLNLASGILTTTATFLLTINTAGTVVPDASNSSFVNGPVSKVGTAAFKFPVGVTGTGYVPVEIGAASGSNTFTAEYKRGVPPNNTTITAAGIAHISYCDYWTLNRSLGSSAVDVTFYWNSNNPCGGADYVRNPSGIRAVHYDGVTWDAASPGVGTGSVSDGSVTWVANNIFGPFALGAVIGTDNPLPVMFADVKAFEKNNGVQIEWNNLTERDLVNYTVEHSSNGVNYTAISQQVPRSNQNDKQSYSTFDATPFLGANFYRIKVLEISGKVIYSKVLKVDIGVKQGFTLYPNPVKGNQVAVSLNNKQGQYSLKVLNTAGQEVYSQKITHQGGSMTQSIQLPSTVKPGVYNMMISGDNYRESKMFVVQ